MPLKRPAFSKCCRKKVALLDILKEGKSYAAVAQQYHMNKTTVRYIKKKEAKIRKTISISFSSSAQAISNVRDREIVNMESALSLWIMDCHEKIAT